MPDREEFYSGPAGSQMRVQGFDMDGILHG
jgi:hypothetical protein